MPPGPRARPVAAAILHVHHHPLLGADHDRVAQDVSEEGRLGELPRGMVLRRACKVVTSTARRGLHGRSEADTLRTDEDAGFRAYRQTPVGGRAKPQATRGSQGCHAVVDGFDRAVDEVGLAQEAGDEPALRTVVDVLGSAHLLHPAAVHDGDPVGHVHGLFLVMGHVDHRHAEPLLDLLDLHLHLVAQVLVERAEGLVHQHHVRMEHHCPRNGDTLLLTARQLPGEAIGVLLQPHQFERFVDPGLDQVRRELAGAQRERDVLEHVQVGEDGVVLEHHAEAAPLRRHVRDIQPIDQDHAFVQVGEAGDHHQRGGLARAGRAEQREELAGGDRRAHRVHDAFLAVLLGDLTKLYLASRLRAGDGRHRRIGLSDTPCACVAFIAGFS